MKELSDSHWCILDLLMRAKQRGVTRISKTELLYNESVPVGLRVRLAWDAMTMDQSLVSWHGQEFSITERGEKLFNAMFKKPSTVSDVIIALPDQSGGLAS